MRHVCLKNCNCKCIGNFTELKADNIKTLTYIHKLGVQLLNDSLAKSSKKDVTDQLVQVFHWSMEYINISFAEMRFGGRCLI